MITLAIEQSTGRGSAALLDRDRIRGEADWPETRRGQQHLVPCLEKLLADANCAAAKIESYAVGLGPGSYSGLRIALATVRAMALPDRRPVRGISSGAALAWALGREHNVNHVTVVGDARRNRLWSARFRVTPDAVECRRDYSLDPIDALPSLVQPGDLLATPDWLRLAEALERDCPAAVSLLRRPALPAARDVGRLVLKGTAVVEEPVAPIYLHPPVFVPPRFPA